VPEASCKKAEVPTDSHFSNIPTNNMPKDLTPKSEAKLLCETAVSHTTQPQVQQQTLQPQTQTQHDNFSKTFSGEQKGLPNTSGASVHLSLSLTSQPEKKFKRLRKFSQCLHHQTESTPPQKHTKKGNSKSKRRLIDSDTEDTIPDLRGDKEGEETDIEEAEELNFDGGGISDNDNQTLSTMVSEAREANKPTSLKDFVDDEAEVSDIDGPVSEDSIQDFIDDRDEDLESFVTDQETQRTPPSQSGAINMNAIYLRSLCSQADIRPANFRSPIPKNPTRFKLRYDLLSKPSPFSSLNVSEQSTDPSSPDIPSPETAQNNALKNHSSKPIHETANFKSNEPTDVASNTNNTFVRFSSHPSSTTNSRCYSRRNSERNLIPNTEKNFFPSPKFANTSPATVCPVTTTITLSNIAPTEGYHFMLRSQNVISLLLTCESMWLLLECFYLGVATVLRHCPRSLLKGHPKQCLTVGGKQTQRTTCAVVRPLTWTRRTCFFWPLLRTSQF
jgi:hypothetical protein